MIFSTCTATVIVGIATTVIRTWVYIIPAHRMATIGMIPTTTMAAIVVTMLIGFPLVVAIMAMVAAFRCAMGVMTIVMCGGDNQSANGCTNNDRSDQVFAVSFSAASPNDA